MMVLIFIPKAFGSSEKLVTCQGLYIVVDVIINTKNELKGTVSSFSKAWNVEAWATENSLTFKNIDHKNTFKLFINTDEEIRVGDYFGFKSDFLTQSINTPLVCKINSLF